MGFGALNILVSQVELGLVESDMKHAWARTLDIRIVEVKLGAFQTLCKHAWLRTLDVIRADIGRFKTLLGHHVLLFHLEQITLLAKATRC